MKIYRNKHNALDKIGLHPDGTLEYYDPNIGSMLSKSQDVEAVLQGGHYVPDTDYEDACRYRMLSYAAVNPGSPEAEMMDTLSHGLVEDLSPEQLQAATNDMLDQVRAKYGERA